MEVNKFAYNEDAPNMELKYDIWCSSEEVSNEVADSLNSLFNTFIADEVGMLIAKLKDLIDFEE